MLDKQVVDMSRALYADLNTPISLGVYLRQKYGEWGQYLAMRPDPAHYLDTSLGANKYLRDAQAIELLRKFPSLPSGVDVEEVALAGFWHCEQQCKRTNDRLRPFVENFGFDAATIRLIPFVERVQRLVQKILGPLPRYLAVKFGPGAVSESRGHPFASSLTVADKMTMMPGVTQQAVDLLPFVYNTAWGRGLLALDESGPLVLRGNRFTSVPKDATKNRGICIEPGANVALQLAIGKWIRRRLRRFGIDLDAGQSLHRALARLGSLSGEIATLDLSSASDTVARALVRLALPEEWYELLDSLRSPMTEVSTKVETAVPWRRSAIRKNLVKLKYSNAELDLAETAYLSDPEIKFRNVKKWVRLEKFSSMGNGFTFELETLLFAAITAVACEGRLGKDVWVYGDDILYPSRCARPVTAALRFFGFTPNERKSFSSGPFRESCGGDFFLGHDVRPYYMDKDCVNPSDWISVANGLWRVSKALGTDRVRRARNRALGYLPADVRRCRGPEVLGDLVIHDHESKWLTTTRSSIRYIRVWRPILKRVKLSRYSPLIQLATALYGSAEGQVSNMRKLVEAVAGDHGPFQPVQILRDSVLVPRNGVTGYRFGQVAFS